MKKLLHVLWYVWAVSVLFIVQSLVLGVAALPALAFWRWASRLTFPFTPGFLEPYVATVIVAASLVPSYFIFCLFLMFVSAGTNRVLGWRTEPGEYDIHRLNRNVIRWGSYNASIQLVRVFAGEFMRTGPFWTWYLKANGARIGKGVYVNTARLFDHNLIEIADKAVVGGDAKLIAHLVERGKVKADPVRVGRGSVIGVNSVVGPGVVIGDGSAVGAMSFVPKNTKIPPNEVWGGVPARCIKTYAPEMEDRPGIPVTA